MILEKLFGEIGSVIFIILVIATLGYFLVKNFKDKNNTYVDKEIQDNSVGSNYGNEYRFICQRCGKEWYMTKKEIHKAKVAKREITSMKLSRFSTLSVRKHHDLTTKIAIVDSIANYDKCPNCGSVNVEKTFV